jgi:hypothetical protein
MKTGLLVSKIAKNGTFLGPKKGKLQCALLSVLFLIFSTQPSAHFHCLDFSSIYSFLI